VPALQTFYLDSTGIEGEKYFYGIVAIDKAGNRSKMSARPYAILEDRTPPPAPKWVKAEYRKGKIRVTWKPVKKEKLRGYYVYRGIDKDHLLQVTPKPIGRIIQYLLIPVTGIKNSSLVNRIGMQFVPLICPGIFRITV
jgi:hypothetical protein